MLLTTATLLVAGLTGELSTPSPREVERRFFRAWLQIERIDNGRSVIDPEHLNGDYYGKDRTYSWGRRGELAAGPGELPPRIDATARPMRVDFPGEVPGPAGQKPSTRVLPCIFRFDGDRLVIANPRRWPKERALKPGEDYAERPRDFRSTKENGVAVEVSKPCAMYDQD